MKSERRASDPFDLADQIAYLAWRDFKLAQYPVTLDELMVPLAHLSRPSDLELAALRRQVTRHGFALVRAEPSQITAEAVLAFGRALGLARTDSNRFADASAISHIAQARRPQDARIASPGRGDYIPYTDKPLGWHTDGYYNAPDRQVSAWTLFCVRPARHGGINSLLDHEIAYIRLRDDSPQHIEALSHPEALSIPALVEGNAVIRPASIGPVFSVRRGWLHMRYSARARNVSWRKTPETDAARQALDRLFSTPDVFTFTHRLESGEGILSNNVLHNRSGFIDADDPNAGRLLLRVRYLDRIATEPLDVPAPSLDRERV